MNVQQGKSHRLAKHLRGVHCASDKSPCLRYTKPMLNSVLQSIESRRQKSVEDLKAFLRIPSISAQPAHAKDVQHCAEWIAGNLTEAKLNVQIRPTGGHPIVLAKNEHKPGRPTVLFYGHYDVQPPEPLDQWTSPAFEPTVRKTDAGTDAIYARGAVDDKGQVWAHIEAITQWQQQGGLPVNITMLIEGEEEVGSENLERFVHENAAELKADIAVISDTGQFARGVPAITYGLRGLVYCEVILSGPSHDLHSGMFGGAVPNPANILCEILASLHDKDLRVNIPGFYDDVTPLTPAERADWAKLPYNEAAYLKSLDLSSLSGEPGYTTLERAWGRPTCDINGLTSGYQGHGAKTIIPASASAKVSMRLVPNQDPQKIVDAFEKAIKDRAPKNVKIKILRHGQSGAVLVSREGKAMKLASEAVEAGFGKAPTLIREGGSIPVVGLFKRELKIDTLLVGFGLPDDRVHSPNEKMDLDALYAGTRTAAVLYEKLAGLSA
ncbi:MAG TPA: dipeptidase [Tepidisphaeraceae bacterium]|jgi:acetylornithine deacetylase/succinyl-diaminopimelate desuccinylase-like protein|nr:dipeptidase [Tepidisphaeraceae bacterium]